MNQSTLIAIVGALTLFGCDKGGEGGGTGSAAKGDTKSCPDGAPLCVSLPAGHTFGDPRSGAWGASTDVVAADKSSVATLYWVKPEEFETRTFANQSFLKATNGKDEQTHGGKGRYQEWDASDPKENRHFIQVFLKTDKNTLQCSGSTPKGDAAKIAALQTLCKSMTAK